MVWMTRPLIGFFVIMTLVVLPLAVPPVSAMDQIKSLSTKSFSTKSLATVGYVDLDRYLGQWFEIARLPNRFQKKCMRTTAEYQRRKDGDIRVINRCRLQGKDKIKQAIGRAWVTDKTSQAKLKVQFALTGVKLPFMAGKYWIIDLAEDYSYAVVGEPSRDYLWILSRTETLPKSTLNALIMQARQQGFPVGKLIFSGGAKR